MKKLIAIVLATASLSLAACATTGAPVPHHRGPLMSNVRYYEYHRVHAERQAAEEAAVAAGTKAAAAPASTASR